MAEVTQKLEQDTNSLVKPAGDKAQAFSKKKVIWEYDKTSNSVKVSEDSVGADTEMRKA